MTYWFLHADDDVTAIEIERWEDDGGAVPPDPLPRRRRWSTSPLRAGRFHLEATAELAAAD